MENKNFNTRGNGQLKDVESNEVYLGSKKVGAEIIDITKKLKDLECSRGYYDIGSKELFDIFQSDRTLENMVDIESSPQEAEDWILGKLSAIRDTEYGQYAKIGIVSGSFDVPHENHTWYLRHCKALLAQKFCVENGIPTTKENIRDAISDNLVQLIVAVDTDEEVSNRKTKMGDIRPIYNFYDRARRISELTFVEDEVRLPIVDYVIPEGPEYSGTSLEKMPEIAQKGKELGLIDEFICFGEHPLSANIAKEKGFDPIVVPQSVFYASNPVTGQPYSSSTIIKKIRNQGE